MARNYSSRNRRPLRTRLPLLVYLTAVLALFAPGIRPSLTAQVKTGKTPATGDAAVIPYAVSTVRESNGPAHPRLPFSEFVMGVGSLHASFISVRSMIAVAFGLQEQRIVGGPAWLDSERFDVQAKSDETDNAIPRALTYELQQKYRLRQVQLLLADRFQLRVHTEQREIAAYALVVTKGRPKMRPSDDKSSMKVIGAQDVLHANAPGIYGVDRGWLVGLQSSMDRLVNRLASTATGDLDRPLVNMTGLTGLYDFQLKWRPDAETASDNPDSSRPDLFTAIKEQLGLKLDPRKTPMDVLVVDHVEMPTEN